MINSLIKLTQKLIQQPSITPNDHNCQNIISNYLEPLHFNIKSMQFHDTNNMWAYKDGSIKNYRQQRTLLFLGHTDVVSPGNINDWKYPPFSGTINNGFLYGRGASDMKGTLSAILIATKIFIKKNPLHKSRIAFLITSDEEGSGINGTKKSVQFLINKKEHIDYCIIGEPTSQKKIGDIIKNGRRGSATGTLTIYGTAGHVAYPQYLNNPIHSSIPIILKLLNTKWDQTISTLFPETSMQIIDIYTNSVNTTNNTTPNKLILKFNFRFTDKSSIHHIENCIHDILADLTLHYHITWESVSEPYFSHPGTLSNSVINTIKHYQKITPSLETSGGISDGRFIIKTGAEVIELGALNHTIHKVNECIKLTDLYLLSCIYLRIMQTILL